jgi:hypothetical protein
VGGDALAQNPRFTAADSAFFAAYEDSLTPYLDSMINSTDDSTRISASYEIIPRLVTVLKHDNSFRYGFDSLQGITIVNSPDNRFRTITWAVELPKKQQRHFGTIQMNSEKLKMFPLTDASDAIKNPEMAILPDSLWFGMVYYNIIMREVRGQPHYFLFGYDAHDLASQLKFIDVLTFQNGEPQFGAQVFEIQVKGNPVKVSRFMLEYSSEVVVTLNYLDEYGKIIFDHVVPSNPNSVGVYFTYVPDGTYEGFEWDGEKWIWIEKVFGETQDSPPFPIPVDFDREERQRR